MESPVKCERCKKPSENVKQCSKCMRYLCEECMDEFSGLCEDCTVDLMKGSVDQMLDEDSLARARVYEIGEDAGIETADNRLCPNCGLSLLVMEETTDGTKLRLKCMNCGYERVCYSERLEKEDSTIEDEEDEPPSDDENDLPFGDNWNIVDSSDEG
ncbi:hypothetical protein MUP77_16055 [Candidatus Bathyarchaeota archaeon]|nr:hypothetical protein [Candidatus Bathyarchaeota archaeon]